MLDDEKYYQEIDRVYNTYGTPPGQDYRLENQAPSPHQTTQELMQIFVRVGDKRIEKNFTDIGLSAQERGRCRVAYSRKSERPSG